MDFQAHPLTSSEGRSPEAGSVIRVDNLTICAYVMKPPVEKGQIGEHGERVAVQGQWLAWTITEAPAPSPRTLPSAAIPSLSLGYPFIPNRWSEQVDVSLSSVGCSGKFTEPQEGSLEPPVHRQSVRSTGDYLDLRLASAEGRVQTCRTSPQLAGSDSLSRYCLQVEASELS